MVGYCCFGYRVGMDLCAHQPVEEDLSLHQPDLCSGSAVVATY